MTREWRRKPLKSLKMDSDPAACGGWSAELVRRIPQERAESTEGERRRGGSGLGIWNAAGPAETQRLERGHQRAGSEYNLEGELRRGKLIFT